MEDKILQGVNVVSYKKEDNKFGMSCAWATQVDYDSILLLIGSQSETGNNLKLGDKVGVSALNKEQIKIALAFGDNHSLSFDKFKNVDYFYEDSAILIKDAKTNLVCEVTNISHPKCSKEDYLIECKILKEFEYKNAEFLSMVDIHNL